MANTENSTCICSLARHLCGRPKIPFVAALFLGFGLAAFEGEQVQTVWVLAGAMPLAACWANQYLYLLVLGFSKFTTDMGTLTVSSPFTCTQNNRNLQRSAVQRRATPPTPGPHPGFSPSQYKGTVCASLTVTSHQYSPHRVMGSSGNFKACGATTTPSCKRS